MTGSTQSLCTLNMALRACEKILTNWRHWWRIELHRHTVPNFSITSLVFTTILHAIYSYICWSIAHLRQRLTVIKVCHLVLAHFSPKSTSLQSWVSECCQSAAMTGPLTIARLHPVEVLVPMKIQPIDCPINNQSVSICAHARECNHQNFHCINILPDGDLNKGKRVSLSSM